MPIGIFDSGLGGLTVFEEIQNLLPHENLIYIADSAFAPYGDKDSVFIVRRACLLADFLVQTYHIKALVVACNTATGAAVHILRERLDIPVIGMEPAIKPAVALTQSGVVAVLATSNTLASDKFSKLLDSHQHQARIIIQPCVGWVETIEQGTLYSNWTRALVAKYVQPLLDVGVDTFVLGCTHYPLLEPVMRDLVGDQVHIISTGRAVARQLHHQLLLQHALNQHTEHGNTSFWTSGEKKQVTSMASLLFQQEMVFNPLPQQYETIIVEFSLEKKQQLLFQALLQSEDGLAFVRCVHGVQQLWTTSAQVETLKEWLKCLPKSFNLCILQEYVWTGE
ncbi:glutamate racemase [Ghiorsea bivora]|uniref:glutamate racemase n=1 Tax=Ghiorsea bivora TaxID=1485545 RepID=UPI0009DDC0A2|nr:glutamate racemase [Ghiorsea bivora]